MIALRHAQFFLAAWLCICWFTPGRAQSMSNSKLSAHLINNYTVGSSNIVAGRPRLLKVLALEGGFPSGQLDAMRDFKSKVPGGKLVVRVYSPRMYSITNDATASANDFWTNVLRASLNTLSPSDRALIDYLEGPNEGETPNLDYPGDQPIAASQWINQFWTNLTPQILSYGIKPCIGSIAVANVGDLSLFSYFVPALRQAKTNGGAWSYHAYTLQYTTDLATEIWTSLKHRQFNNYFAANFSDLADMTMILTEGGVDFVGDPSTSGWQARGSAANYERWLNWFDYQMAQDSYVLGCTLFENGDPGGWSSFDLEPIATWFGNYLTNPSLLPPAPTGLSAVVANIVTLNWTNISVNPTTYNVKRATNSGGPYTLIARNITEGVPATTVTDTTVTSGVNYFYVVTALNAIGESANSAEISVTPTLPKINCGDGVAGNFAADIFFNGGLTYNPGVAVNTNGVSNPAPMAVYQSQRYGNLTYTIPFLQPGNSYKVRLHFTEVYNVFNSPGQRVFDVFINGAQVLDNFDIFVAAGGQYKANIQEFNAISDATGKISIQLVTVVDNASINGIELIANSTNSIPSAPTNLSAAAGDGNILLNWFAPAGATSFKVKRSTTSGANYSVIASNLYTATFTDTSFTPGTPYYYVVSAVNGAGESTNSNQATATPTNALPDVVVTAISWTPTNVFANSNVVFKATVKNQGSASTPGGTTLGVGFSVDGALVSWSVNYSSALAPGASVTLTANGGPNSVNYWPATPGTHTITANVDDINRFPEGNENNNITTTPLTTLAATYAVNCGGPAVGNFSLDDFYTGSLSTFSVTNAITVSGASNPAPAAVYQSERWGTFGYVLPNLGSNNYFKVRLHFAEISPSVTTNAQRQFNVSINGAQVLTNFDIFAAATGKFRAVTRLFNTSSDDAGQISIQFSAGAANQPKCSGLEILPYSNAAPVLAAIANKTINAGAALVFTNTATDSDIPADALAFSLTAFPAGATMGASSGIFSWTAPQITVAQTNPVTVLVTDNGLPQRTDSKSFNIVVVAPPKISSFVLTNGNANFSWQTYPGKTYRVQFKNDLNDAVWTILGSDATAGGYLLSATNGVVGIQQRYYRILQLN